MPNFIASGSALIPFEFEIEADTIDEARVIANRDFKDELDRIWAEIEYLEIYPEDDKP